MLEVLLELEPADKGVLSGGDGADMGGFELEIGPGTPTGA